MLRPYTLKLDEEKLTYAGVGQENSVSPAYLISVLRPEKAQQICSPGREECNKYDLTAAPCF